MDPYKPIAVRQRIPLSNREAADDGEAEAVALQAVAFIVGDEDLMPRFVALTGCGGDEIRARLAEPAFLGAVLDFLLADEPSLLSFAAAAGVAPDAPMRARRRFP